MLEGKEFVLEICRQGSFTRAAEALYITQPALSSAVKKLESKLGFSLFDRSSQPVRLTPDGEVYAQALRQLEQLERETQNRLNSLHGLQSGSLTVGGSALFASVLLPPILKKYHASYPGVELRVREGTTVQLAGQLLSGELDLLLDNCSISADQTVACPLAQERLCLAVPPAFCTGPLAQGLTQQELRQQEGQRTFPIHILGNTPLVLLHQGNDTTTRVGRMCREHGFRPNVLLEPDQLMTAFNMAASGLGATVTTDLALRCLPYQAELRYFPLESPHALRQVQLLYRRQGGAIAAVQAFVALTQQELG